MASFDPYRKWLGIPPEDQPPHHYRLLGIGLFEADSDVIANAADRQMAHVRSFQSGKYAELSQRLLNELSAARLCLLDAEKRAAYDASLKSQLAAHSTSPPAAPPSSPPAAPGPPPPAHTPAPPSAGPPPPGPPPTAGVAVASPASPASIGRVSTAARTYPTRRRNNSWQVPAVLLSALVVAVLGVALMLAMDGTDSTDPAPSHPNGGRTSTDSFQLPEFGRTPPPTRPNRTRPRREPEESAPTPGAQQTSAQQERPAPGPLRLGEMAAMEGHAGPVLSTAYAPDGVFVVTGGRDKTVRLWDTAGGTELRRFRGADEAVLGVGFSRDANTVYALTAPRHGAGGGNIHFWETGIGGTPNTLSVGEGRRAVSFALAPDGGQAAVGCEDGTIRLIDLAEGDEVRSFSGHEGAVNSVVFSTDGNALLSGGEDGAVLAFNRNTGTEVRRFAGHEGAVRAVVIAPDGSLAVSGGDDRLVCVWDVRGNRQRAELRGHEQAVTGLAFSADGERAVSVGFDGKLIVWQVRDLREGRRFDVPGGPILAVALGAEGDRAVTASQDGVVRLWGLVASATDDAAPDPLADDPDPAGPRTLVPDDGDVQTWTDHIRNDLFQDDFQSAQRPEEKVALAEELLGRAREPKSAPDAAYAFLDLAVQLAIEAGDAELALSVIDELAERYEVDGLAMKMPHLRTFAAEARSAHDRGVLVRQVLDTVDRAGRQERFDLADQLLDLADAAAGSAHAEVVDEGRERVAAMRKAFDDAEAARQKLEQEADDPQAALALGKYECFVKGDWQAGLPLLARGADERLAELAETELAEPTDPQNQMALADAWWDLAESESGETQTRMRWRAAAWYKRAEPNLEGAIRDQVEGRILAVGEPGTSAVPREPPPEVPDLAECRKPETRDALLRYYGGDAETEAAVGRALEWLVRHQSTPEGYWSFDHQGPGNRNRSANPGTLDKAPNAATALALLALMGAGHSPRRGEYRRDITAGLNFLRSRMVPVGSDAGTLFEPQAGTMPSHAMAACALCEAVAVTADAQSIRAGQAAVNFIVNTQNADGGWADAPQLPNQKAEASNVFATAWNVQALKTAQWAGLKVPDAKLSEAEGFFDSVHNADGDGFAVEPRTSGADPTATAAALLSLMYLGWQPDRPEVIRFAAAAAERGPAAGGQLYRNLCTAQLLREFGGQPWAGFSTAMRRQLLETQADTGPEKGSWYFDGSGWNHRSGGRLFSTAMAVLILETDYRHPPLAP